MQEITVFLASPDEVKTVRKVALKAVEEMAQGELGSRGVLLRAYDQDSIPPTAVDRNKGEIAEDGITKHEIFRSCDLFVMLFWRRLGSETAKASSGTVQEFYEAYDRYLRTGKPKISIYFQNIDALCLSEPCLQIKRLRAFQRELKDRQVLWGEFGTITEFEHRLKNDVRLFLREQGVIPLSPRATTGWHILSGFPDNVTDQGYVYRPPKGRITPGEMESLAVKYKQLREEEVTTSSSLKSMELYRLYRRFGDYESARIHLERAQSERKEAYVEVLNEDGSSTGREVSQTQVHKDGSLHATCHTFALLNRTHIYLQRRSADKVMSPGRWAASSCGHVRIGETLRQAARREISEELGLPDSLDLKEVEQIRVSTAGQRNTRCEAFAHIFCVELSSELDEALINRGEMSEVKLISLEKVKSMLDGDETSLEFANDFIPVFYHFWEWLASTWHSKREDAQEQASQVVVKEQIIVGDQYQIGQAGVVGPHSHARDMDFSQIWQNNLGNIDLSVLAVELSALGEELKKDATEPEHDAAIGSVALAEVSAKQGSSSGTMQHLARAGKWALEVAQEIGTSVASAAIKQAMGLP
jgi:isopentenyldiphosphate isomerase